MKMLRFVSIAGVLCALVCESKANGVGTFPITVECGRTIRQISSADKVFIEDAKYFPALSASPDCQHAMRYTTTVHVLRFNGLSAHKIIESMRAKGMRPASLIEALSFSKQYPGLQKKHEYLTLDLFTLQNYPSAFGTEGELQALCLDYIPDAEGNDGANWIHPYPIGYREHSNDPIVEYWDHLDSAFRFLAVKESKKAR